MTSPNDCCTSQSYAPISIEDIQEISTTEVIHHPPMFSSHPMVTRSKVDVIKPNPKYALIGQVESFTEPTTVKEALNHPGWL